MLQIVCDVIMQTPESGLATNESIHLFCHQIQMFSQQITAHIYDLLTAYINHISFTCDEKCLLPSCYHCSCALTGYKLSTGIIIICPEPRRKCPEQGPVFVQRCFRGSLDTLWMAALIIFPRDEVTFLMAQSWREESLLLTVRTQTNNAHE